ncbi:biotin-dependent carboxyltransferase family protein [Parapedobacter tibetensis]|uniref:5-oxoprolinase subunit C family protein n=1 Tax=Parapedobacter tibetensis TaxID=2972951 RepID=UPI00214DDD78|nr:biotin-dependent carboxyltransferase family protein [Parapedobacter tibetensis]
MAAKMQIRIIKPGLLSTMQDTGRWNYLSQGMPISGAMDTLSSRIANLAVGNNAHDVVIEFTYGEAEFQAETDILLAYSGDGATLRVNSLPLPPDRPLFIPSGTNIHLANNPLGSRTYLAIAGGWDVAEVLGSKSTYVTAGIGGYKGRALEPDDLLNACGQLNETSARILQSLKGTTIKHSKWGIARWLFLPKYRKTVHVIPAHEFTWFAGKSVVDFLSTPYTVSIQSNRMGYRLEGPSIHRFVKQELLSTAVVPGTIQVTGDGSIVLLMADCQTTGGYPRIAQVAAVDIPLCAQLKPGDAVNFKEISRTDAEKLYIHQENQLDRLAIALKTDMLTVFR